MSNRPVKWERHTDGIAARFLELVTLGATASDNRIAWQTRLAILAHAYQVPSHLLWDLSDADLLERAIEFVTYWSTPGSPIRPEWLPWELDSLSENPR